MCGEQLPQSRLTWPAAGSPPRVRGTAAYPSGSIPCCRITPACAGNSTPSLFRTTGRKDHPRVCGEQFPTVRIEASSGGSPPRVRGTASALWMGIAAIRITPACAGNSSCLCRYRSARRDHPRVCGEQSYQRKKCLTLLGSPPRVRGTAVLAESKRQNEGITPACAGNRLKKARHFNILFCQIKRIHLV